MTVGFLRSAFGDAVCGRGGGAALWGAGAGASAAWWSQAACSALSPSSGSSSSSIGGEGSGSGAAGSGSGSGGGGVGGAEPSSEVRSYPTRFARFFDDGPPHNGLRRLRRGRRCRRLRGLGTSGSACGPGSAPVPGSGSGSGSAGGGEFRNENAEPVDSRPVAGGSGSAGVAGASGAGDGGFDASCFTERPPKRSIACDACACATRATRGCCGCCGGALLRHECDAALYCKTAAGESCAVCLALQASATSQKAQQLMSAKKFLWLVCYMPLATAVSRKKACVDAIARPQTIQVLSSFAAPDIAGRASIGALPHSAEGQRGPGFQSLCAHK